MALENTYRTIYYDLEKAIDSLNDAVSNLESAALGLEETIRDSVSPEELEMSKKYLGHVKAYQENILQIEPNLNALTDQYQKDAKQLGVWDN